LGSLAEEESLLVVDKPPFEEVSGEDAIAMVVQGALYFFTMEIAEYRDLLASASDRSREVRPRELQRLGERIRREQRRQAEEAAHRIERQARAELEQTAASMAAMIGNEVEPGLHHPAAPEQMFAAVMLLAGQSRVKELVRELVEQCGGDPATIRYAIAYSQWTHQKPRSTILARALLPALVASFESLLAALARLWLMLYPEAFGGGQQQVLLSEVHDYASREDILLLMADRRADAFVNQDQEQWKAQLTRHLHIDIDHLTSDWSAILEAFLRRNAIIHNGGRVDNEYLARLPRDCPQPDAGTQLETDAAYLNAALDRFSWLGTALSIAWLAHFTPENSNIANMADGFVVRALEERRWRDAYFLATLALSNCPPDHAHHELKVNRWMARRELGDGWEQLRGEIEVWEPPEPKPRFRAAKALLLGDEATSLAALKEYARSADVSGKELATWPLVVEMAKHSKAISQWAILQRSGHAGLPTGHSPRRGKSHRR